MKAENSKLPYLDIILKNTEQSTAFYEKRLFHFMFQISYYMPLYDKFLSFGVLGFFSHKIIQTPKLVSDIFILWITLL